MVINLPLFVSLISVIVKTAITLCSGREKQTYRLPERIHVFRCDWVKKARVGMFKFLFIHNIARFYKGHNIEMCDSYTIACKIG